MGSAVTVRGIAAAGASIVAAVATAVVLTPAIGANPAAQIASCHPGPVTDGNGGPGWRRTSLVAGPVGVARDPLRFASPYGKRRPHQLVTKMPMLVDGHESVRVSVPRALRNRVFLYYGFHPGPRGGRSASFYDYPGDPAVVFRPCLSKPRTVWPGGIRMKGRRPVRLVVGAGEHRFTLRLGRPRTHR